MLHFIRQGWGNPVKVLFIHGNTASAKWWIPTMELLWPVYDMLAVDLKGFGESGPSPQQVSLKDHVRDVLEVLESNSFDSFYIVGHSLGGAVAMALALACPQQIRGLVLVDSAPIDGMKVFDYRPLYAASMNPELFTFTLKTSLPHVAKDFLQELLDDCRHSIPAIVPNTKALAEADFTEEAKKFQRPVLVIHGEQDWLLPRVCSEKIAQTFPQTQLVILKGASHNPQMEKTTVFIQHLQKFITDTENIR